MTKQQAPSAEALNIVAIPAFTDNYIWSLERGGTTWVVDPGDAKPVEQHLADNNLELAGIIVTHHHYDHTGGIPDLMSNRDIPIVGPGSIDVINQPVVEGSEVSFQGLTWRVIEVPGHTLDHIAFFSNDEALSDSSPILLCGDTLFAGGCGRLFEGTPEQMHQSLGKLAALPSTTRVYCTHEYTLANLNFAIEVEPENNALKERLANTEQARENDQITLPSTIELEKETNPFLRSDSACVKTSVETRANISCSNEVEVFAAVRAWKDDF